MGMGAGIGWLQFRVSRVAGEFKHEIFKNLLGKVNIRVQRKEVMKTLTLQFADIFRLGE